MNKQILPFLLFVLLLIPAQASCQSADSLFVHYRQAPDGPKGTKSWPKAYRIQLFSGTRQETFDFRLRAVNQIPTLDYDVQYDQPYFKVFVGAYAYRMQAEKALPRIRISFPGAFVVEASFQRSSVAPSSTPNREPILD